MSFKIGDRVRATYEIGIMVTMTGTIVGLGDPRWDAYPYVVSDGHHFDYFSDRHLKLLVEPNEVLKEML